MSDPESTPAKRFFFHPVTIMLAVGAAVVWAANGFPPFGFPDGEYACVARSGAQEHPISVYRNGNDPMKVIQYLPGEARDVSAGMTYSHGQFERHLNLNLYDESYRCVHVG